MTATTLTQAEREALAKQVTCPACQATAGNPCMKNRRPVANSTVVMPGSPMKGVHDKRLARVPRERTPAAEGRFVTVHLPAIEDEEAKAMPCLTCGAQPGFPCTGTTGQLLLKAHEYRYNLLRFGGEVNGVAWTRQEVQQYGLVVKDNKESGSNSPTPDEWRDQQADRKE